tara:strand:- start:1336 stop:1473 length:138 start_codon:yes stop_codon:yes gene_type:complete
MFIKHVISQNTDVTGFPDTTTKAPAVNKKIEDKIIIIIVLLIKIL